jgi:hypothetical protein
LPIAIDPLKIVNVSVPSFTTPAGLVTVADSGTVSDPTLKVADAEAAAVAVAAALMMSVWLASVYPRKLVVPLYTALMM